MRQHGRDERGVATLEFVVWIPVLLLALGFAVVAGRVAKTDGEIQGAVRAAARAASLQRSSDVAQAAAQQAAAASLSRDGVTCHDFQLRLDVGAPGGLDVAQLRCSVPFAGAGWALPGPAKTISATFASAVDTYRAGDGGPAPDQGNTS